jgi:hypothetical protein
MLLCNRTRRASRAVNVVCAAFALFVFQDANATCGAAFCMVNTNWNLQGFAPEPGLRIDARFEYIDQDQPMTGNRKVPFGRISRHHDELRTINRNYITTLDYTIDADWGVTVTFPFVDRSHDHIHNHRGAQLLEQWSFTGLGDARVLARRQWMSEDRAGSTLFFYGITAGVKAPTGEFDRTNRAGDVAERSLQPGSGTTDVLLGSYFSQVLPAFASSWFAQVLWQAPLSERDDYKPGRRLSADVGYRYEATERVGLMLQLNALHRGRDSGAQAEPADTGGEFLFVSPGVSYAVSKAIQLYAFFQKPLYQHVNGVQLVSDWSVVAGLNMRF